TFSTVAVAASATITVAAAPVTTVAAASAIAAITAITPITPITTSSAATAGAFFTRLGKGGGRKRRDEVEAELATVDPTDPDLHLLSQVEILLDPLDSLRPVQLGEVEQAVAAGKDADEGTALGDVDALAFVLFAELGLGRDG